MGHENELSRRVFLAATASLAAAACSSDSDGGSTPENTLAGAKVALVGGDDPVSATNRAIELGGGLSQIRPGDTVFIKPNAVHGSTGGLPGIVPSNEVLETVIRRVKDQSPGKIILGDRSARFFESQFVFDQLKWTEMALASGADEVYPAPKPETDPDAWVMLQPPHFEETWADTGGILAMRKIVEADHLIDVAQCKNHEWAAFTFSMKNLMGAVGDDSRDPMHYDPMSPARLSRDIAVLNQLFAPLLSIVDARHVLVNGGPDGILKRVTTEPGIVLAGNHRVALDAVAASLLKQQLMGTEVPDPDQMYETLTTTRVWDLPQLKEGVALGLDAEVGTVSGPTDVTRTYEGVDDTIQSETEAMFLA